MPCVGLVKSWWRNRWFPQIFLISSFLALGFVRRLASWNIGMMHLGIPCSLCRLLIVLALRSLPTLVRSSLVILVIHFGSSSWPWASSKLTLFHNFFQGHLLMDLLPLFLHGKKLRALVSISRTAACVNRCHCWERLITPRCMLLETRSLHFV